uniref:Uncharacterized protein n=1 Tax=Rhodopseudomonas palustris (strain DX-1) TaxID=652103 RepID=E6VHS9_RHOPX
MACNGFNHPTNCQCDFRGGQRRSRPPDWHGWVPRIARRALKGPTSQCPECHAPVYFIRGRHGGGPFFDKLGPPWPKHACTDKSKKYSVYSRSGRPRLRVKPGRFETDRWLPFFVRHIEKLGVGTIIHGHILDVPTVEHLGTLIMDCEPDSLQPVYFRTEAIDAATAELNYFPVGRDDPVSCFMRRDCKNEIDLILKCKDTSNETSTQQASPG